MKLLSATVKNYRIHSDTTVHFDDKLTLIGGLNESGKSTFAEAVHRALFLKSTTGGELQKAMQSHAGGTPEVAVRFATRGATWNLRKVFAGNSAKSGITLAQEGGAVLNGVEAEEKLAALLGSSPDIKKSELDAQWAHLWVWQGSAGADPSAALSAQRDDLVQRVQKLGGAVALQSEIDALVAAVFVQKHDAVFTTRGVKVGSDLEKAGSALAAAEQALAAANEQKRKLEQFSDDFIRAENDFSAAEKERPALEMQAEENAQKLAAVAALENELKTHAAADATCRREHQQLVETDAEIKQRKQRVAKLRDALAPLKTNEAEFSQKTEDLRRQCETLEQDWNATRAALENVRAEIERANAASELAERTSKFNDLKNRADRVAALKAAIKEKEIALAALPAVEKKTLRALQKSEAEQNRAADAVRLLAAEIEILAAETPVAIGGAPIAVGERRLVSESVEIATGSAKLRISPGGGQNLETARAELRTATEKFTAELAKAGVKDIEAAIIAEAEREALHNEIKNRNAEIDGITGNDDVLAALTAAEQARAAAQTRVNTVGVATLPLEVAKKQAAEKTAAERNAEHSFRAAQKARDSLAKNYDETRQKIASDEAKITSEEAQFNLLLEQNGDDDARAQKLANSSVAAQNAAETLAKTRDALAKLDPETLSAAQKRLERALAENDKLRRDAENRKTSAAALLRSEGSDDPVAALVSAQNNRNAAAENAQFVAQKADAVKLLKTLFEEEQKSLADALSKPLATRMEQYLRTILPNARVAATLDADGLSGIAITHNVGGSEIPFENLSGGAKEQLAAAIRLAAAELLAQTDDGALPVIFDDAFAFSDPERVHSLQGMLDLAARRGLQIIVLTCNPADYATLGAKTISLPTSR